MKVRFLLLTISICLAVLRLSAQKIELPIEFSQVLAQTRIEMLQPLDAGYRDVVFPENEFQTCQYAIASRREDLLICYAIFSCNEQDPASLHPSLLGFRAATSAAINDETTRISVLETDPEVLKKDFNADWGMTWFFQPKPGFSTHRHCRLTAIYKEGRGTALIFYLFDDPANTALDLRQVPLRFL